MIQYPQRYPTDEAVSLDGDGAFYGVDMREDPAKLPAGRLAYAENARFDGGDMKSARGCISLQMAHVFLGSFDEEGKPVAPYPDWDSETAYALNARVVHDQRAWAWMTPGGSAAGQEPGVADGWELAPNIWGPWWFVQGVVWGAVLFDNPAVSADAQWVLASGSRLRVCRKNSLVSFVNYPAGVGVNAPVQLVPAFNRLFLIQGDAGPALVWDGVSSEMTKLEDVPPVLIDENDPAAGVAAVPLPNGVRAFYHADRLHVIHSGSQLAIGGIASELYDDAMFDEVLNFGTADRLVTGYPFDRTTVLVFGERSIYGMSGASGSYANLTVFPVSRSLGTIAPGSVAGWGRFCAFLSPTGVWTVEQAEESRAVPSEFPLSQPIEPLIQAIEWRWAHRSTATIVGARYFLAVPWRSETDEDGDVPKWPNTILIYNTERREWEGHWRIPEVQIAQLITGPWEGAMRLFVADVRGYLLLLEEGETWQVGNMDEAVRTEWISRGYNGRGVERARGLRMLVNYSTQGANLSLWTRTNGIGREDARVTNRTRNRLRNLYISKGPRDAENENEDWETPGWEDYSIIPPADEGMLLGSGVRTDLEQEFEEAVYVPSEARFIQLRGVNETGSMSLKAVRMERRDGDRSSLSKI